MLVHFPIALWPAHFFFHVGAGRLPPGVAGLAGFWTLAAGTALGAAAMYCGLLDLIERYRRNDSAGLTRALRHGVVNGSVWLGFLVLLGLEWPRYPNLEHGAGFLAIEAALLVAMILGNYLGGEVGWETKNHNTAGRPD